MRQQLQVEQQQQLHLTTELQQGIAILNMNAFELADYLKNSVEENPLLEFDPRQNQKHPEVPEAFSNIASSDALLEKSRTKGHGPNSDDFGELRDKDVFQGYTTRGISLEEHLESQLSFTLTDSMQRGIAHYLIGNIDRSGYLRISDEEAAQQLGVSVAEVSDVVRLIQSCQPPGIGAHNLQECLLIQLEGTGQSSVVFRQIVQDHLEHIAEGKIKHVARALEVDEGTVQIACDVIRSLDPRPGLPYEPSREATLWPEISIIEDKGEYRVEMQDMDIPLLRINDEYASLLENDDINQKTEEYLKEKLKAAEGLLTGVEQRRQTMYRVACSIVELQEDFFRKGIAFLKPLTMAHVASLLDVHESTISRIVNGNYLQTPRGVYEMRYFFDAGGIQASSQSKASKSIKDMIKALVEHEDPYHPLSDSDLQSALADKGVDVSRRTVNKYRQSMNILSQAQRRRYRV